jgi:CDP-paratose 2-epimerase
MEIVITGSSGLIGSEAVEYFAGCGHRIHGIDNNMRADFFGPQGDTLWRLKQLLDNVKGYTHHRLDIRNRAEILEFFAKHRIGAVIHCAAQPSHDLAKDRPFDDFDVNAGGTLNLLERRGGTVPTHPSFS